MIRRANTILYCKKWRETVAFYREILTLPIVFKNEWFVEFRLGDGAFLSIADERRATIKSADGTGITLAWQVEDLAQWHSTLVEQGVTCTPIKEKWGASVTYFYDPEGHRIELWQPSQ